MEISIFERNGKTWTRFKVKVKELQIYAKSLKKYVDISRPVKQSWLYVYFEVEGDFRLLICHDILSDPGPGPIKPHLPGPKGGII